MGVSLGSTVTLAGGADQLVFGGPGLLTSVVAAETTGAAPAAVAITDKDGIVLVCLAVRAGDSVVWSPCEPVAVNGLKIGCQMGDVTVSYSYR